MRVFFFPCDREEKKKTLIQPSPASGRRLFQAVLAAYLNAVMMVPFGVAAFVAIRTMVAAVPAPVVIVAVMAIVAAGIMVAIAIMRTITTVIILGVRTRTGAKRSNGEAGCCQHV
jgi:uncharacterized membrane protein